MIIYATVWSRHMSNPSDHSTAAQKWIVQGFESLSSDGPHALKAETLSQKMGVTKGSFYWHFNDIQDFHQQMIACWELHATAEILSITQASHSPTKQLELLAKLPTQHRPEFGNRPVETALRAWGVGNSSAANVMDRIDRQRLEMISEALRELDLTNPDFGRILYGASIGMNMVPAQEGAVEASEISTLLAAMLSLRDA